MLNEKLFRKLQFYSTMKAKYDSEYEMLKENKNNGLIEESIRGELRLLEKRIKFYERRMVKTEKKLNKT